MPKKSGVPAFSRTRKHRRGAAAATAFETSGRGGTRRALMANDERLGLRRLTLPRARTNFKPDLNRGATSAGLFDLEGDLLNVG